MRKQLELLVDIYKPNENDKTFKRSDQEHGRYLRRKNNLEAKLFKKKYERVAKHICGIPNGEKRLNPFTAPYKPSVYAETIMDPKMDVPQNVELFDIVIDANDEALKDAGHSLPGKKVRNAEQEIEDEIKAIRERLRGKISEIKEENHV